MATLTPHRPLEAALRARWDHTPPEKRHTGSASLDDVEGAVRTVLYTILEPLDAMSRGYYQYRDEDAEQPIGHEWLDDLTERAVSIGRWAFDTYVVPAVVAEIAVMLPHAPAKLRAHPDAELLRADLAALKGEDR